MNLESLDLECQAFLQPFIPQILIEAHYIPDTMLSTWGTPVTKTRITAPTNPER